MITVDAQGPGAAIVQDMLPEVVVTATYSKSSRPHSQITNMTAVDHSEVVMACWYVHMIFTFAMRNSTNLHVESTVVAPRPSDDIGISRRC